MRPLRTPGVTIALAMAFPLSGQAILRSWHGQPGDGFGACVAALGDTDLDGSVDFAVGAPDRGAGAGAVDVFSCGSGALLRSLTGTVTADRFGIGVWAAGDLDRDGSKDLWVQSTSSLYGYSGRDGSLLWRYAAPPFFAPMSDYDADGHDDLALVDAVGDVLVHSGRNGAVLGRLPATTWPILRFAVCGDVDGDGSPDVMTTRLDSGLGYVDVWSVRSGQSLFQRHGYASTGFGDQIGAAGDVDRDGRADFFVHEPDWWTWTEIGITTVYSGATLAELWRDTGVLWCDHGSCTPILRNQGYAAAPADVDGDGRAERFVRQSLRGNPQVAIWNGSTTTLRLPSSQVAAAGDADRDGLGDFLVTAAGEVRLVSAARTARRHHGVAVLHERSHGCEACEDANGDGYADYWVSRALPHTPPWSMEMVVTLHSGRDGSALWSYHDPVWGLGYRIELATGGDVDHDGSPDVAVAAHAQAAVDEIRVYGNLQASMPALILPLGTPNTALAVGADWTGDGTTDVFSATSSVVEVRSGATGGLVLGLPFGATDLRLIGDVDGDTVEDLLADDRIVGSHSRAVVRSVTLPVAFVRDASSDRLAEAWIVDGDDLVLVSVVGGRELRRLPAPSGGAVSALATASDWNRDGWYDLVLGQPDWEGVGRVAVLSGLDGSLLHTEWGEERGDAFGSRVGALAFDPLRYADPALVASAARGHLSNTGYGRWVQARMHPGGVDLHGIACGAVGVRPELLWSGGAPRLGGTFLLEAIGLRSGTPTIFFLGTSEDRHGALSLPASLGGIGMPGCVLHVAIDVQVPAVASGVGRASMPMVLPNDPALLGSRLFGQSLVVEPAANQRGLLTSDAARIVVGR